MASIISVIMPVRNVAQYVHFAVESILNQSFKDFEFIILDDASTDNTRLVLDEIRDSRIVRINNENQTGNYKCRNQGLCIAQGKYIAVMDGDDIAYFDRLQVQFEFMESNLQYLATGSNIEFFSDNNIQPYLSERIQDPEKNKVWLLKDNFFSHPTLFVRKKVFEYYKIRYSENYYYAADYDLILSISQVGNITNISKPLLRYRIHRNQITALKRQEQIMYADQIRLKQLSFLRMRPSVEEMMVHLSLMKDYPIPELKLSLAEKWCNKLLMKNNRLKVYNQEYLYEFLKERLMCAVIK